MTTITIELSDAQARALHWDCLDPAELFRSRADIALHAMARAEIERRLLAGEGVPAGASDADLALSSPMPAAAERLALHLVTGPVRPQEA